MTDSTEFKAWWHENYPDNKPSDVAHAAWQAARTQPQQQAQPANRHIAAHMFIREREIDMSAREAALEQALRKIIRERDVYGWSPEVDEAIESARAALATTKDKL